MPELTVLSAFQKQLSEWEKKFRGATRSRELIAPTPITTVTYGIAEKPPAAKERTIMDVFAGLARYTPPPAPLLPTAADIPQMLKTAEMSSVLYEQKVYQKEIEAASNSFLKTVFYEDFYGSIPALVGTGAVNSVDEALSLMAVPPDLSQEELQTIRQEVSQLLSARDKDTMEETPYFAEEEEKPKYPPLVPPPTEMKLTPVPIHQLSVNELVKSLKAPQIPETSMNQEEYNEFLLSSGWSQDDIDNEVQVTKEQLIAEAQNRKNMIEAARAEGAKIPELKLFDMVKMAVINPPMLVLEGLNIYYEHVSMPAAGWLYGQIPDIKKAYEDFKGQNPDATEREAHVYAWKKWEAPGPPVLDFILKYMIMEGVVDPLSYVGWGFVTKGLRSIGPAGRMIATGNMAAGEVLELPFDFIKWFSKSVIPKTVAQRAAVAARESQSILKRYFELYTKKYISRIKPKELQDAVDYALNHLAKNPRAEDDIAKAAREILVHPPVSRREALGWMERLRRAGANLISDDQVTETTLLDLDTLFERVFGREITAEEAAPHLLSKFEVSNATDDITALATRFLANRAESIISRAPGFALEKTAGRAMRTYSRNAMKAYESQIASEAFHAAQKTGRVSSLLYNVERNLSQLWAARMARTTIRQAAESYLTFGMYGPMNVFEDVFRSVLGGVKPGRVTVEQYDIITMGLLGDPELRRAGISEMIGPLRETGEAARTNWFLTISLSPLSVPTYLATAALRRPVTPKKFSQVAFKTLVELFGGISAEIRRNFVAGRYSQLLSEYGGDAFKALLEIVPKDLPSELATAPKWVKRNLLRDLRAAATSGKLTSDNTALINSIKGRYTRDRILRAEVDDIIKKYPDLSPTSRSMVMDAFDEHMLLDSPESLNNFMKTLMDAEVDDFLRSPERAVADFDQLTELLTSMEVARPEDMAELIVSLHRMTTTYGMLPDQVMARATVKSRGLPINDRRLQFDPEMDRIANFIDKAGVDIDRVVSKIAAGGLEERIVPRRFSWLTDYIDQLPVDGQATYAKVVDFMDLYSQLAIRGKDFLDVGVDRLYEMVRSGSRERYSTAVKDALSVAEQTGSRLDKVLAIDTFAQMTHDRGSLIGFALGDPKVAGGKYFDEATLIDVGQEAGYIFDDLRIGDVDRIKFPPGYEGATQRYLDMVTSARRLVSDAKTQDIAFRHGYFADVTQKEMDRDFWNSFYATEMAHWNSVSKKLATINSQLHNAINDINVASGLKMPVRPAVKVLGRPLAPADVAKLMQTRGDDLSRMLLDTLIPEGDKDYFVEYIMGMVKQGYDEGFDRASVEAVYDQIAASIQIDPASQSWFRIRQKQIESMSVDFHDLYNAKLFPKEQKIAVDTFVDRVATGADDAIRTQGIVAGDYDKLRQQALDESNKWYYKEYTDYTNANALDAVMKQLYPFWTYESQRWFWLPRSFVRHPGTLTAWGRWENNTDYGYIHIPGTSIDVNPMRGTIYGPWSTRMMRRDYPEYYDELEGMGGMIGFFDFISRYGFYPNVIFGALQAQFGGATGQLGGILPSIASTPLNAMIAAFPDNPLVSFISERVFPEMFRQYLTARGVDDRGGDGSLLYAKKKAGQALTEEEEAMWAEARRSVALHSAAFEQLGFARMRSSQAYELAEASAAFIEEQWGYTPEQQKQMRLRGDKIWDEIGGLDPWETAMLQELEFFKYSGSVNPVLPSRKQEILNKIELDWADVMNYSESQRAEIVEFEQDFLTGSERGRIGPDTFLNSVRDLYRKRREYIDEKTKANPLMLLENRTEFYAKYRDPMPVQSPYNELMDLFFSIELEDTVDPATGERVLNWDKFWANREMITDAIPADDRKQWDAFMSRNTAPMMQVWQDVYSTYLKKYYELWNKTISTYSEDEQKLINEFLFLEKTGQQLDRQAAIKEIVSPDGRQLISGFRSSVSDERAALRYANPHLDAWLFYWGRTTSFKNPQAEQVYRQLSKDTGRIID